MHSPPGCESFWYGEIVVERTPGIVASDRRVFVYPPVMLSQFHPQHPAGGIVYRRVVADDNAGRGYRARQLAAVHAMPFSLHVPATPEHPWSPWPSVITSRRPASNSQETSTLLIVPHSAILRHNQQQSRSDGRQSTGQRRQSKGNFCRPRDAHSSRNP